MKEDHIEYPICINGKRKMSINIDSGLDNTAIQNLVLSNKDVQIHLDGAEPKKVIIVPGRMVNLVI